MDARGIEETAVKLYDRMSQAMFEINDDGASIHNAGEVIGWLIDALTHTRKEAYQQGYEDAKKGIEPQILGKSQ